MRKLGAFLGVVLLVAIATPLLAATGAAEAEKKAPAILQAPTATPLGKTLELLAKPQAPQAEEADSAPAEQAIEPLSKKVLDALGKTSETLKAKGREASQASVFHDFNSWLTQQHKNKKRLTLWLTLGENALIVLIPPILIGAACALFLFPVHRRLARKTPKTALFRSLLLAGLFFLRLVPTLVFFGTAHLLLNQNVPQDVPHVVLAYAINVLALFYAIKQGLRTLLVPVSGSLRVLPLAPARMLSAYRWFVAFVFVGAIGYFVLIAAAPLQVPPNAIGLFRNLLTLLLGIMSVAAIFKAHRVVATFLRGERVHGAAPESIPAMRVWLARHWHLFAIAYIVACLSVIFFNEDSSLFQVLRGTVLSLILLIAARLGFLVIEKWKRPQRTKPPLLHRRILAFFLHPMLWLFTGIGIALSWGFDLSFLFSSQSGQHVLSAVLSIVGTVFILTLLYELIHRSIEHHLTRTDRKNHTPLASARARTLLPMLRASIFILFAAIAILSTLSSIGVDIAPLLAGAGIIGVAIGFGSQTLIKDFLTGLFIVAENSIAVGDIIKIDTFSGIVEDLSIRTIRLRDLDGSLHILPFSEVSKITNMSKGFAYAVINIGVSYDADLDHVMDVMRGVGAAMQKEPEFRHQIIEPIDIMGVEALEASSIVIRARMRTQPSRQWSVRRALLLRIKKAFDAEGIEIPFPIETHIVKTV
ncbi:MAG: mechanosensitive ion channel [Alphaproteobacteria bacterium]|nr:mechanosensitive ion channel [Alphaproteobacteria bacterium]